MDAITERLSFFDRKGEVEFERGGFDFFCFTISLVLKALFSMTNLFLASK